MFSIFSEIAPGDTFTSCEKFSVAALLPSLVFEIPNSDPGTFSVGFGFFSSATRASCAIGSSLPLSVLGWSFSCLNLFLFLFVSSIKSGFASCRKSLFVSSLEPSFASSPEPLSFSGSITDATPLAIF